MNTNTESVIAQPANPMPRRAFLTGSAALAGVLGAQAVGAQEGGHEHHDGGQYAGLAMDAVHCVLSGEACLSHCLILLKDGDTAMAECARATRDLSIACSAMAELASLDSKFTKPMTELTMAVCQSCEKECNKHLQHETCATCARFCAMCIESCKEVLG